MLLREGSDPYRTIRWCIVAKSFNGSRRLSGPRAGHSHKMSPKEAPNDDDREAFIVDILVDTFSDIYLPQEYANYGVLLTFALLVAVLAVRPLGLFGRPA